MQCLLLKTKAFMKNMEIKSEAFCYNGNKKIFCLVKHNIWKLRFLTGKGKFPNIFYNSTFIGNVLST